MALKRKHLLNSPQANGFFSPKNHSSKVLDWKYDCSCFQGIEQLKKEERRWAKKTKWMNMKAVFGHPFSLGWASPFATPDQGKADPYQYVVWRTLSSIATQTQTTSQHYRPIRSHECLNRKKQHNYSETFFFNENLWFSPCVLFQPHLNPFFPSHSGLQSPWPYYCFLPVFASLLLCAWVCETSVKSAPLYAWAVFSHFFHLWSCLLIWALPGFFWSTRPPVSECL